MSNTIRELVILDFIARASEITVANEYNTDIGTNVLRARKKVDPDDLPLTVIWAGAETAEHKSGYIKCKMQMKFDGLMEFGSTDPSVISEQIIGDLKKCFLAPENNLSSPPSGWSRSPDYIDGIVYTGSGPGEPPDDGQTTAGAYITLDVSYYSKLNDPYSQ